MALFSTTKEKKTSEKVESTKKDSEVKKVISSEKSGERLTRKGVDVSSVLLKPMITEKAIGSAERGAYVFEVHQDATKIDVREAVESIFKVTPQKINIVRRRPVAVRKMLRGVRGQSRGYKKAFVFLKKGDRIELA